MPPYGDEEPPESEPVPADYPDGPAEPMPPPPPYSPAPAPPPQPPPKPEPRPLEHWWYPELGARAVVVKDPGFDPYATTDLLGQLVLAMSVMPLHLDWFTLGGTAEYDVGSRRADVRGSDSLLAAHRISVGVLADAEIIRHLHAHVRLSPGAYYLRGSIDDRGADRPLVADGWTWSMDLSAGLGVMFGTFGGEHDDNVAIWARAEFGYSFAGEVDMAFSPEEDDEDPRRFGAVELPPLSPRGFANRLTVGVSF